jgi:FkbM family methyltransferase
MESFSQHGQDIYVYDHDFKHHAAPGTYVDIGAYDGVRFSNSFLFEKYLRWRGICIEPLPSAFMRLKENRTAHCVNCAISDYSSTGEFLDMSVGIAGRMFSGLSATYSESQYNLVSHYARRIEKIEVEVRRLGPILDAHRIRRVDYMSIDTEGSELKILMDFDFAAYDVSVLSVENNTEDPEIRAVLRAAGYRLAHVFSTFEELYTKEAPSPRQLLGF